MINEFKGKYSFLSNFYKSKVTYKDITYPASENAYQAQKNDSIFENIFISCSPAESKKESKKINLRSDWELVKYNIMYDILLIKFSDPTLKQLLIDTYPHQLIEGNYWHDNYWGMCNCDKCLNKKKENNLGKILMKIRDILMNES